MKKEQAKKIERNFFEKIRGHRTLCRTCKGLGHTVKSFDESQSCPGCDGDGTVFLLSTMVDLMLEHGATPNDLQNWFSPLFRKNDIPVIHYNERVRIEDRGHRVFDGIVSEIRRHERLGRPGEARLVICEMAIEEVNRSWENTITGLGRPEEDNDGSS